MQRPKNLTSSNRGRPKIRSLKPRVAALNAQRLAVAQPLEVERLRGRALIARSERILARDPCCKKCEARGVVRASTQVDHIVPLHLCGSDEDAANLQGLCDECHAEKTAEEQKARARGEAVLSKPAASPDPVMA